MRQKIEGTQHQHCKKSHVSGGKTNFGDFWILFFYQRRYDRLFTEKKRKNLYKLLEKIGPLNSEARLNYQLDFARYSKLCKNILAIQGTLCKKCLKVPFLTAMNNQLFRKLFLA